MIYGCFLFKYLSFYRTNIDSSNFKIVEVVFLLKSLLLLSLSLNQIQIQSTLSYTNSLGRS